MTTQKVAEVKKNTRLPEFLRNPNSYVIIFILILCAMIATWIIPAGQFERVKDEASGKTVIVADSFKNVESAPVNVFGMLKAIPIGVKDSIGIITFIFIISGSIQIIKGTGALDAGIIKVVNRLKGKDTPLLVIITILFTLLGAAFGFAEETIPFIPLGVSMALALGYDRMVGFHIVRTAAWIGFAGAFLNPFSIGVAQSIAELPLFSGLGFRVLCYFIFLGIGLWFIIGYAKKVKKDPSISVLYNYEGERGDSSFVLDLENSAFTLRQKIVLLLFLVNIGLLIFGVIKYGWYTTELSALFLGFGIICGFVGGMPPNGIAKQFCKGMAEVTSGAIVVGLARAIVVILDQGIIMDTIIYGLSRPIMDAGAVVASLGIFAIQSLLNFFIGSSSGLAAATMPIMVPLGDLIGVTRQTTVLAFQFGDGITNMLYPAMMYYLVFADIPYSGWFKHILKLVIYLSITAAILTAVAAIINYGPF
ncbi:YfcC family protein [Lutispora saccharofermentans]|uniref:AbgT family transporter n=1 Tax=Lutispora saccharofermentans TaxID=3024236 RepID=A0ABT1NCH4_9FIRM|nr:AbgT family transporter [Lutispora saccharofermentans]MCQ1528957.1 AbgT family transporter [Lutispora saccharofermentans]